MSVSIEFKTGEVVHLEKWFKGTYKLNEENYNFFIMADWTKKDKWSVLSLEWETTAPYLYDEENDFKLVEIESEILAEFLDKVN